MRTAFLTVMALAAVLSIPAAPPNHALHAVAPVMVVADAQQAAPSPPAQVDVQIHRDGRAWYASPVWIAIGALGLIVLILLIIVAARGGGTTTVVR